MTRAVIATLHNRVQQLFAGKVDKTGAVMTGPLEVPSGASGNQVARISDIVDLLHPIGSIWITMEATDPNSQFQGTTWERIAAGRVLIGSGTLGSDTYAPADTGGEARHTLTITEMPAHNHAVSGASQLVGVITGGTNEVGTGTNVKWSPWITNGGNQAHENRMPYLAVNYWRRIN